MPTGLAHQKKMGSWARAWAVAAVGGQARPGPVNYSVGPSPARSWPGLVGPEPELGPSWAARLDIYSLDTQASILVVT